jgi:hypothetical protein
MICQKINTPSLSEGSADKLEVCRVPRKNWKPVVGTGVSVAKQRRLRETQRQREYRERNRQHLKEYAKRYYHKHKTKLQAMVNKKKKREWEIKRNADPEYKKRRKDKYQINRERICAQVRALNKLPHYREKYLANCRRRRRENIQVRIAEWIRGSINTRLRKRGAVKADHTVVLIGCTIPELRAYLEARFLPGMQWYPRNFDVDHIVPVAAFDLRDPEQQKKCFNFSNLRPMWPIDNQRKGAKLYFRSSASISLSASPSISPLPPVA